MTKDSNQFSPDGMRALLAPGYLHNGHAFELNRDDFKAIEVMRRLRYGRIEAAPIRSGTLILGKTVRLLQSFDRHASFEDRKPKKPLNGRQPHRRHYELIAECRAIGTGVMDKIEVADGLPVSWVKRSDERRRLK